MIRRQIALYGVESDHKSGKQTTQCSQGWEKGQQILQFQNAWGALVPPTALGLFIKLSH